MEELKLYDGSENVQMLPLKSGVFCFTVFSVYIFLNFLLFFFNILEGGMYTVCALY
jgi:hypothetical protein